VSIFTSLLDALKQMFTGISNGAPMNDVTGTTIAGVPVNTVVLRITRNLQTTDATFGDLRVDGVLGCNFTCKTLERTAVMIPTDLYNAQLSLSGHFGFLTPHLDVPNRTYIEIHPANYPIQLEGCIAVGKQIDGDALDYSDVAFEALIKLLPQTFQVSVVSELI
jgi:hypothetical protein